MCNNIPADIYKVLNHDFLARVTMASSHIVYLLQRRANVLYESFNAGFGGDISNGADLLCESIFARFLLPVFHIDSEESGLLCSSNPKGLIILDPLDGSSNFKSDIPYYGASIAVCDIHSNKLQEAAVINYITQEISYMNDSVSALQKCPCVFRFSYKMPSPDIANIAVQLSTSSKESMKNICDGISKDSIELGDNAFLSLLDSKMLYYQENKAIQPLLLESGIFEKCAMHGELIANLASRGIKFRSLGATAISLGFSFRYLFVLLPRFIRKYDGMAGLYLSLGQHIIGDLYEYYDAIPMLRTCKKNIQYTIISRDLSMAGKLERIIETISKH